MFNIPVTVPVRFHDEVDIITVSIDLDKIAVVKPLLDNKVTSDVESNELYDYRPLTELVLLDGRKLPICEAPGTINRYLDAYRQIENFYATAGPSIPYVPTDVDRGVVIPLFPKARSCVSSEGSIPA